MDTIAPILIANTSIAVVLALLALAAGRLRRPALVHALWLLVLVKLLTPPVWHVLVYSPTTAPLIPVADVAMPSHSTISPVPALTPVAVPPSPELVTPSSLPAPQAVSRPIPWIPITLAAWAIGSATWLCLAALRVSELTGILYSCPTAQLV